MVYERELEKINAGVFDSFDSGSPVSVSGKDRGEGAEAQQDEADHDGGR